MTPDRVGPLVRSVSVAHLPPKGTHVVVEATEEERAALARDLDLPAIRTLTARLRVVGTPARVHVTGRVTASLTQTCVITLDPFESELDVEVEVAFRAPMPGEEAFDPAEEVEVDLDAPDELVDDRIDLGAIAAEFLALGLDPYPRKPGIAFEESPGEPAEKEAASPFAALAALRGRDDPGS